MTRARNLSRTVSAESLTLPEFALLFVDPPIRSQREFVARSGIPQPRVSDLWRGIPIYPKGMNQARAALGGIDEALLATLLANAARVAADRPGPR